jgi:hypothetical protein
MIARRPDCGSSAALPRPGWTALALTLLVALTCSAAVSPSAATARKLLPPKTWTGTVSGKSQAVESVGTTTTWTANVRFDVEPAEDSDDYTYWATGTVTYTISGGRDCTMSGSGTFPISEEDGVLGITRVGSRWMYEVYIVLLSAPPFIVHETCPDASGESEAHRPPVLFDGFKKRAVAKGMGSLTGTFSQGFEEWSWNFSGTPRPASPLQADPGGPYKVKRAGRVKLDGSGSRPRREIEQYKWSFRPSPSDCPEDVPARTTHKEGRQTKVVALCGLRATLTVVDRDGDRDSASTVVNVLPRGPTGWRTPFAHRAKTGDPRTPRDAPSATSLGGGNYGFSVFGGLNVSDCGAASAGSEILCPLLGNAGSWLGKGYELAKVNDPKGPFDGYSYVASSQVRVKRAALINPSILPGSPFYQHNVEAGRDAAEFLNAIRQHEGLGNGTPGSGHSLIMRTILRSPTGDARRVIERLFGPNREGARKRVDTALRVIERRLDRESEDPLPDIWSGDIDFYDAYQRIWIAGQGFRIPGNMRG